MRFSRIKKILNNIRKVQKNKNLRNQDEQDFQHNYEEFYYKYPFQCESQLNRGVDLKQYDYIGIYKIIRKLTLNKDLHYERWQVLDTQTQKNLIMKVYTYQCLERTIELITHINLDSDPDKECDELEYLNHLISQTDIKTLKFEACLMRQPPFEKVDPAMPYFNIFDDTDGFSLSELCIHLDKCRNKLDFIIQNLLDAVEVAGSHLEFDMGNIQTDDIFIFENLDQEYMTIADFQLNSLINKLQEESDIISEMGSRNIQRITSLIMRILSRSCSLDLQSEFTISPLHLYLTIHKNQAYRFNDFDLGVDPQFEQMPHDHHYQYVEKNHLLKDSIYDFMYRCMQGKDQFKTIDEAKQHPFFFRNQDASQKAEKGILEIKTPTIQNENDEDEVVAVSDEPRQDLVDANIQNVMNQVRFQIETKLCRKLDPFQGLTYYVKNGAIFKSYNINTYIGNNENMIIDLEVDSSMRVQNIECTDKEGVKTQIDVYNDDQNEQNKPQILNDEIQTLVKKSHKRFEEKLNQKFLIFEGISYEKRQNDKKQEEYRIKVNIGKQTPITVIIILKKGGKLVNLEMIDQNNHLINVSRKQNKNKSGDLSDEESGDSSDEDTDE